MVVMYGIKNCDTIKKARRWLEATAWSIASTITVPTGLMQNFCIALSRTGLGSPAEHPRHHLA
jgi:hypothetical protein